MLGWALPQSLLWKSSKLLVERKNIAWQRCKTKDSFAEIGGWWLRIVQGRPFPNLSGSQMLKLSFRNVCQNFCSCRFPPTPSRHGRFDNSPRRSIGVEGGRRMLRISLRERKLQAAADDDFFHRSFHKTRLVLGGQLFSTVVSLSLLFVSSAY